MSDTTISLKNSTTSGSVPPNTLVTGEVAINIQDKKAWVGLASGTAPVLFVDYNAASVLSSGAITSGFIGDGAVNSGNIASGQIGRYHLSNNSVFSGHVFSSEIGSVHLNSGAAIGNLAPNSITSGYLANDSVSSINIASGSISGDKLRSGAVQSGHIANNAVNSGNISSGSIGHFHLADDAVQSGNIASGNVGLYKLDALTTTYTANSGLLVNQVLTYTGSGMIWKDPESEILIVRNNTGVTMPRGSAVYISGGLGNKPLVTLASATDDTTSSKTIGLLQDTIGDNEEGRCLVSGILEDIDTVSYSVGDRLFLSLTAGQWTTTRYQPPVGHTVYLGTVIRSHINFGRIAVTIQNGFEITELHDVRIMSGSTSSGQVLQYTAQSGGYWENSMYSVGSGYISNGSILSGNIASGQIGQFHLGSGTSIGNLSSGSIKSGGWILGDGVVQSGNLASGLIPTSITITSGSISSGLIANNAVVSGSIASGQVSNFHLSSGAATFNLLSGSVSNNQLANSAISINGASTALGGSYSNAALTISTGLTGGSYNGSGAVTIALASGAAQANLLSGSIGSGLLANNSVVSGSIASGQIGVNHLISGLITTLTLGSGQVTSGSISSGSISNFKIASGAILSGHVGNNTVVSGNIASGQVSNFHLANNSISINGASTALGGSYNNSTLTIGTGLIGGSYNGSGAVTIALASGAAQTNLLSGSIGSGLLANNSVVSGSIASGQIGVNHLISGLITTLTLGSGQVTSGSIASGAISNFKIASGAILSGHVGDNSVVSGSVASGQIGTNHLANASVASGSIASGQIGRMHLSSGAVNSGHLANNSVVSGSIASGQINTYHIGSTTTPVSGHILQLNGTSLQYNAPAAVTIASGSITSGMIGNNTIVSGSISSGLLQKNVWTSLDTQVTTGNNFFIPQNMTLPSSASWQAVAYGNGRYVALTTGATAAYSNDGQNWISNTLSAVTYSDIAYGTNIGLFLAITNGSGSTYYSSDGINFFSQTQPVSVLTRLKYGNGVFLALGTSTQGAICNSVASFSSLTLPSPDFMNNWTDLEFGNKTWVIIQGSTTASATIYVSKNNGTNWTSKTLPASINQYSIAYGFGRFIITAASSATYYYSDDDGDTWQSVATGVTADSWKVKYDAGVFYLIPTSGTVAYIIQIERGSTAATSNPLSTSATWSYVGAGNGGKVIILPSGTATGQYVGGLGNYNFVSQYASEIDNVNIGTKQPRIGNFLNINVNSINVASGIAGNYLTSGIVRSGAIASGQIGQFHFSDNSVRSGAISSGQVGRFHLSDNSVTSGAIASGQVGRFQHADNSVFSGTIASGQIGQFHNADNSVFSGAIASGQIGRMHLSSGSVNSGHIGDNAVVSGSIASGQISRFHLGNESVFSGNIGSGQIGPVHLNQIIPNNVQPKTNNFRLGVQSGVAITSTDQSAQSTLYLNPYTGNQISLYNGTNWKTLVASGAVVSLAITGLTSGKPYDVFAYENGGGSIALEYGAAWTTVNTRADAIQLVNGVSLKSGTLTRRLVGTIFTTSPTTTNDTINQRYVSSFDNQVSRQLFKTDATNHTYNSTTPRIWNLTSGNQIQYVASQAGIAGNVGMQTASRISTGASFARTQITGGTNQLPSTSNGVATLAASGALVQYMSAPSASHNSVLGYNFFYPAESCTTAATTGTFTAVDLFGEIKG